MLALSQSADGIESVYRDARFAAIDRSEMRPHSWATYHPCEKATSEHTAINYFRGSRPIATVLVRRMHSKNITQPDRLHMGKVKSLPCAVCDAPAPSEAHHIEQGLHFTCIPLCERCHRGSHGWHGTKALWRVRKMTEMKALNETIRKLCSLPSSGWPPVCR